ncbi:BcMID1, Ca2+ channel protein [Xylogone sp. PMI_703]|nr:BcMID1, Ca2+ channel protein [Xylogone sp. PMI_703]
MRFPKFSPLQSRLAASLIASLMLILIYFTFSSSYFAYAAELDSMRQDLNYNPSSELLVLDLDTDALESWDDGYQAEFVGLDRSIIGRVPTANDAMPLINNRPVLTNVPQGVTMQYMFSNASLFGDLSPAPAGFPSPLLPRSLNGEEIRDNDGWADIRSRQLAPTANRTLYISVNTCQQPTSQDTNKGPPPQLVLYISQSENNTAPGPAGDPKTQQAFPLVEGAILLNLTASGDVYMGLSGVNTTDYDGVWNAEIAASIDAPYHYYNDDDPNLFLVDSDSSSALLITNNLTTAAVNSSIFREWLQTPPPFVMFASSHDDTAVVGLRGSYCGLEKTAQIAATKDGQGTGLVQTGITTRGLGGLPKQQFYFNGLSVASSYYGILAMNGNSTATGTGVIGGGGKVYKAMNFTTLSDGNCAVIFNLSFCDQTAYAVPGNPRNFPNFTSLAAFYDNATQSSYQFFQKVLAQIPCNTTSSAQYSLARTCDDCAAAYKEWLCSVSIPRCTDFSSTLPWLQERNMGQPFPNGTMLPQPLLDLAKESKFLNSSRNPNVDSAVQPGPYKEVLPCNDMCYNIVQSCPASMGFACPLPRQMGFNLSYGLRPDGTPEQEGQITCNYPGAAWYLGSGSRKGAPVLLAIAIAALLSVIAL